MQFSFKDLDGINTSQNFTKQSFEKNGHPVYYSIFRSKTNSKQMIVWRNSEDNAWLSQTRPFSSNDTTKHTLKFTYFLRMNIEQKSNSV